MRSNGVIYIIGLFNRSVPEIAESREGQFEWVESRARLGAGAARPSGVPLGDLALGVSAEDATSYPWPGQVILYAVGVSEPRS